MAGSAGESPRVTVLLPTHNRADVLPFAVHSVLSQTVQDFELIIVGDGCTDETNAVVSKFDDPRILWLNLPKAPGIGYANRNAGLRLARGRYIAYQAHDDLWLPDHLEIMLSALERTGAEFAYSRGLSVKPDGTMWPRATNLHDPACLDHFLSGNHVPLPSCTVVHTRDCLEKVGYWDETILRGGDHELWRRIIRGGSRRNFIFVPEPTSMHFVANWRRKNRKWRDIPRRSLLTRLDLVDRLLPDALHLDVSECSSEQEAIWDLIESDPAGYTTALRDAVTIHRDAMLWQLSGLVTLAFALAGRRLQNVVRHISRWHSHKQARQLFDSRNMNSTTRQGQRRDKVSP